MFHILALSLLAFRMAAALGNARVVSNCGSGVPIHVASVRADASAPDMAQLSVGGYSEPFAFDNTGISIKIAPAANGPITQFEFTWMSSSKAVAYDISNIDGNPFADYGTSLVPSGGSTFAFPTCVAVDCPAGQDRCDAAYNLPDDVRTKVCPETVDLIFTLCPNGPPNGGWGLGVSNSQADTSIPAASPAALMDLGNSLVQNAAIQPTPSLQSTVNKYPVVEPQAAAPQQSQQRGNRKMAHQRRNAHAHRVVN